MWNWFFSRQRIKKLLLPVCLFDKTNEWTPQRSRKNLKQGKTASAIRCAFCNYVVTSQDKAITMNGQHRHIFTNPMGTTYEIALYHEADCVEHGIATQEYTWFSGCRWQVALCGQCKSQLGWHYVQENNSGFYGLICKHLVEL